MKKIIVILLVILTLAFQVTVCGAADADKKTIKMAYLTKDLSAEQWQLMSQGCIDLGRPKGIEVTVIDCNANAATQVTQIESCIQAGYNVIVISPADREAVSEACKQAIEAGIHIVSLDGKDFPCQAYVAADEYENAYVLGVKSAEWVNENWPDKKQINVCLLEYVIEQACVERAAGLMDGFKKTVKVPVNVVASISPPDAASANTMCESVLQAYTVDVALAIAGDQMYGFCLAAENAGIAPDKVFGAAMDITPMAAQLLSKGKYVKMLGSWGSPSVEKALVHLRAVEEALKINGLTDNPVRVAYDVSYIDGSTIDQTLKDFGWQDK